MTGLRQVDHARLAELRREWRQHPEHRGEIEAEVQQITAVALLRHHLGAEVVEATSDDRTRS